MYSEIKEAVRHAIAYSQNETYPEIDELIDTWAGRKKKFIDRFGGPIYEFPQTVTFTLDPEVRQSRIDDLTDYISCNCLNPDLGIFIEKNKDTFFDNRVSDTMDTDGVVEGMKLVRSFKFFEKNKDLLTEFQNRASQIIQEDKVSGKLCFSVHPMDFLTSSENTYHWRSCHSLDGEYRAGNLSYMVDECTFMVYLKTDEDVYIPAIDQEWNSKKWRVLMYASPNDGIMFAGRQYPFSAAGGLDTALNIYNDFMVKESRFKYSKWSQDYAKVDGRELVYRYFMRNGGLERLESVIYNGMDNLAYNDVLCSSLYKFPYYTQLSAGPDWAVKDISNILVGGPVCCIHCGGNHITRKGGHSMRCDPCELEFGTSDNEDIETCAVCGTRIFVEDAIEVDGGNYDIICQDCYERECFCCDNCDRVYYNCEVNVIRYEDGSIERYCDDCVKEKT